jgi:hypothetical protein
VTGGDMSAHPHGRTHFPGHAGPCVGQAQLVQPGTGNDRGEEMEEVTLSISRAGVGRESAREI